LQGAALLPSVGIPACIVQIPSVTRAHCANDAEGDIGGQTLRTIAIIVCVIATLVAQQAAAQQTCPSLVVSNNNDVINGDTSSPCALIASPGADGISLREALLAANNATGSGTITITFAPALAAATIALSERFAPITRDQITLTGLTSNGQPAITVDATHASNPGPILFIAASYFAMSGLNFPSIPTNFHGIQIGGFYFDLMGNMVSSPAQLCCVQITGNAFSNGTTGFAVYVPTSDSNETISDVTIANNSFSQLYEAINIQGGGLPNNASNSVIEDVVVFGNSFSQITPYAGVEVGNTAGSGNQILRTQILQNNFSNSQQGVELDSTLGAQNSVVRERVHCRHRSGGGNRGRHRRRGQKQYDRQHANRE
jgi:hypothetical protein